MLEERHTDTKSRRITGMLETSDKTMHLSAMPHTKVAILEQASMQKTSDQQTRTDQHVMFKLAATHGQLKQHARCTKLS